MICNNISDTRRIGYISRAYWINWISGIATAPSLIFGGASTELEYTGGRR